MVRQDDEAMLAELAEDLSRHAAFGDKYSGGKGDLATADWISAELGAAGYEVTAQDCVLPRFDAGRVVLEQQETALSLFPQPVVTPTPAEGVAAPLAIMHDVVQAPRMRGRIAVLVTPYGRQATIWHPPVGEMLRAAHAAGALAAIVLVTGPSGDITGLNTPTDAPFVPMTVAIGRPDDLPAYLALAENGETCRLVVTGETRMATAPNVIAQRRAGPRWIAMSTPRSGFFTCTTERGSGTAAFLAMARRIPRDFPEHSVFLMNTTGHELNFAGTHAAIELAPPPEQTDVWVHVGATLAANDMQETRNGRMVRSADPNRYTMATPAMMEIAAAAFDGLSGLETPREIVPGAGELSTIADRGYAFSFATIGQSRWFHTPQDTLDKLDPALLLPVVRAHYRALADGVAARG